MLLAIAAVALAATARSSMGLAVNAVQARQELQRKWGGHSIRHTTLELAPILLEEAEVIAGEPITYVSMEVVLNGQSHNITVRDEQAKVNINALLQYRGRDAARTFALGQFNDNTGSGEIYLPIDHDEASALSQTEADIDMDPKIVSINHLLTGFNPDRIDDRGSHPLDALTCWGDGRINIRRASDDLIHEITMPLMGSIQINRLRDVLATNDDSALNQALTNIGVREDDIPELMRRLSLNSRCYSVWLTVDNGRRRWHELSVLEQKPVEPVEQAKSASHAVAEPETPGNPLAALDTPIHGRKESAGVAPDQASETVAEAYPRLRVYQW
ncbi:MAG: hypothetical protein R3C45_12430 [Phycisphaerales bacterium]